MKKAINSNWVTTKGENIDKFELSLESYHYNAKKIIALNSGTSAIHLALILLGVKTDDEVICQSFTFCATANPILYLKAKPIFVDSEKDTWNMCPNFMEQAIKDRIKKHKKPKAIIVVDTYGMPARWDEVLEIASKYNIPVIEDSAEALGSKYKGKQCGLHGELGIFSFNGNKIITTSSGGALLCNTTLEKERIIHLATQAKVGNNFTHNQLGYNYRMSNVLAGIGRGQLLTLKDKVEKRREINKFYQEIFKNRNGIKVFVEPNKDFYSNHWLTCVLIDKELAGFSNKKLQDQLFKDKIETRMLWNPLHLQDPYKGTEFYGDDICDNLYKKGLCLPSGSNLTETELERIKMSIYKFFN